MPTYVYRCQQCGATLERRQGFQDAPLTRCEVCEGELKRVLQPVGIIFRGSGFYSTDYRSSTTSGREDGEPATTTPQSNGTASESTTTSTPVTTSSESTSAATTSAS